MTAEDSANTPRWHVSRRAFLAGTIATALAACSDGSDGSSATSPTSAGTSPPDTAPASISPPTTAAPTTAAESTVAPVVSSDPFSLGVASGDPLSDSVILWTRLHPEEDLPDEDIEVEWEVATDDSFAEIVASGSASAVAALAHSVHVDVSGLEANTEYVYRFRIGEFETTPARTRTFAAAGEMPEQFTFAVSSCQNWEQGYYAAYRDLVDQPDVEAFVFLGDYIYEYASGGYADDRSRTTGQDFEAMTLDQYRQRYALYKTDELLQKAHARIPWIITWDDHEVENDYAGATSENDDDVADFLERRAAAYQAWYEHMPVRLEPPSGPDYEIYRAFSHGDLVTFHVLDERQYRADQQRSEPFLESLGEAVQVRDEAVAFSPEQTMLGDAQREWLIEGVAASNAVWDVLAQQVYMFGGNAVFGSEPPVVVVDTWDGYAGERQAVLEAVGSAADNLVVLTGDFHSAVVADLRSDPFDQTLPVIGTEFMSTSISSSFFDDDGDVEALVKTALESNPQIKFFDARRGYTLNVVTPTSWRATYRAVEDQFDESSPVDAISTWVVTAGTPGPVQVD